LPDSTAVFDLPEHGLDAGGPHPHHRIFVICVLSSSAVRLRSRGRVRADLRSVHGNRAVLDQPGLGAQPQRVDEHRREGVGVPGPEAGDRDVVGEQPAARTR
jgi:hypothetical protein